MAEDFLGPHVLSTDGSHIGTTTEALECVTAERESRGISR
jgi:hypothetical protein